jgi:hypothetical protein
MIGYLESLGTNLNQHTGRTVRQYSQVTRSLEGREVESAVVGRVVGRTEKCEVSGRSQDLETWRSSVFAAMGRPGSG